MNSRFEAVILAVLLFAGLTGPAEAADKAGCKDPDWAPKRLANFAIDDCQMQAWTSLDVSLAGGQKTLEGTST